MKNNFKKITTLFFIVLLTLRAAAQFGQMPPFTLSIEAISGTNIPGFHSFAFAQSGDKWLIIGGRTNGLHGLNSNDGFPAEYKNDKVIVIDTTTWTYYSADLNQLPYSIADPMRSTNMQYIQDGNYLYMAGGFGYDTVGDHYVTFPTLTAIHINNMINAVINAQPIASSIRQVVDTNMRTCGGDLGKIGNNFYLCFGHDFEGRYADPPVPIFTQQYSNRIKKFNINDDGTTITLSGMTYDSDTTNYHRRDLNVGPVIRPDGSFALQAYGGVFQKTQNLPYREPILIQASGTTVNNSYQQFMSQYTCANIPAFDSVNANMYSTFLGGISLYDYNPGTNAVVADTNVPFISDITTMTMHAAGTTEETVLPLQLTGLLGANAKFVLNENVAHYVNGVINLRQLPATRVLVGYMLGGIRAQTGNFGSSTANDSIYRIYFTYDHTSGIDELTSIGNVTLYPNPASQSTTLLFTMKDAEKVRVTLTDITGKELMLIAEEQFQKGNQKITVNTSELAAGIYICKMESKSGEKVIKLVVGK
ncbi:MAG: hypothetical protein JWP12_3714 [Bacteroidetes bacterium]|nr:hypothetical protein [Bacteroidota bacterium]